MARKRHKANFNLAICKSCVWKDNCKVKVGSKYRTFYFTHKEYLSKRRQQAIRHIPENRQRLRANIEATIREFTHRMPQKKLKVRGFFRTSIFAYSCAVAINFGRIYRYLKEKPEKAISLAQKSYLYVKDQIKCLFCIIRKILNRKFRLSFNNIYIPI